MQFLLAALFVLFLLVAHMCFDHGKKKRVKVLGLVG